MAQPDLQGTARDSLGSFEDGERDVISGPTTLFGRCTRVERQPPGACFRRSNGQLVEVSLSEDLAREIAQHLHEDMRLEGNAVWSLDTWQITTFVASRVLPYRPVPPSQAFESLADAAGDALNGMDAAAYVRDLRADA